MSWIADFLAFVLWPLQAVMSWVLVQAHRMWSGLVPAGSGWAWVAAIMTFAVVVRLLTTPLFLYQVRHARRLGALAPLMRALQEQYADDQARLGEASRQLLTRTRVRPTAGCAPLVVQIVVVVAWALLLFSAAHGRPVGYFLVRHRAVADSLAQARLGGIDLSGSVWLYQGGQFGATQVVALVLAGCLLAVYLLVQVVWIPGNAVPRPADRRRQVRLVMVGALGCAVAGVALPVSALVYGLSSSLWGAAQQGWLARYDPTPGSSAHARWRQRLVRAGRDPDQVEAARRARWEPPQADGPGVQS